MERNPLIQCNEQQPRSPLIQTNNQQPTQSFHQADVQVLLSVVVPHIINFSPPQPSTAVHAYALNGGCVLQCFECSRAIIIRNEITFDSYWDCHFILLANTTVSTTHTLRQRNKVNVSNKCTFNSLHVTGT